VSGEAATRSWTELSFGTTLVPFAGCSGLSGIVK
jgi:hypothetical protein